MMKNRDTASNPYRVPKQTSPTWIKVSIGLLVFLNFALMGTVVYLVLTMTECKNSCNEVKQWQYSVGEKDASFSELISKMSDNTELMPQDGTKTREDGFETLVRRVGNQEQAVSNLQESVIELGDTCRTSCKPVSNTKTIPAIEAEVTLTTSGTSKLLPNELQLINKVPQLDYYLKRVDQKLTQHIAEAQKVCKEGHVRYGVYCYVVSDAGLSQDDSKHWCKTDFGPQANLAIIKDEATRKFITSNLASSLHSYWVGIERPISTSANLKAAPGEQGDNENTPETAPNAFTSKTRDNFMYSDGTSIQNDVFEMWLNTGSYLDTSKQSLHDCVALTFQRASNQWYWVEHSCGSRISYICQYYILSS